MIVNAMSPAFRFGTLRNSKPTEVTGFYDVMPGTTLVQELITINESTDSNSVKLSDTNTKLQAYITGANFIKTKTDFFTVIDVESPSTPDLEKMYDNLIVRLLTKSNTNEVYGLLVKYIREFASALNSPFTVDEIRIIIPERITFSFTGFSGTNTPTTPSGDAATLLASMSLMLETKKRILEAKDDLIVSFSSANEVTRRDLTYAPLHLYFRQSSIVQASAEATIDSRISANTTSRTTAVVFPQTETELAGSNTLSDIESINKRNASSEKQRLDEMKLLLLRAKNASITTITDTESFEDSYYGEVFNNLEATETLTIEAAERQVNSEINRLFNQLNVVLPGNTFALVSGNWVDVTNIVGESNIISDESGATVYIYSQGCYLKYPIQVADLRVIEQQTVGYVPAEIAHINNTQRGEKNTRVTRRLKKVETLESLISESEVTRETDVQSTEKFNIENDAYNVQQEENSMNVNASVSGSYGPVSATVSGGYSSTVLQESGNSTSQSYAKEILTRITDRVSNRVRSERSVKTIEEFEEIVTHEIDNSTQETKSYVYRWLNKLVRGTLKNYGKRMMFLVDVAHPAHFYLSRAVKEKPQLNIPTDPRQYKLNNVLFNPQMIDPSNYLAWGRQYNVKLEPPPEQNMIVSETFSATSGSVATGKLLPIKKGYKCTHATVSNTYGSGFPGGHQIRVMIGNSGLAHYLSDDDFYIPATMWLNGETENLAISIMQGVIGYILNVEVHCSVTSAAMDEWKTKCYYDILDGYDKLKQEADAKINGFDINAPGLSPGQKMNLIKTEIKKEAIRKLFRCNPFWVNDNYEVGKEYYPNCCADGTNAERVRFIESVFDWNNMTYELFPYFYDNKTQWNKLLDLTDDDPHFESFMRASFASVKIPVFRDNLKEIAACNFLVNNSIGNYETIPEGLEDLLNELATEPVSFFTYDLEGNEVDPEVSVVDLGVFPIPTSLVILECTNQDGVEPIPFPMVAEETTTLEIPKQYSPAIIANSCTVTP